MFPEHDPVPLAWPDLPDEAVVELHGLINNFMVLFESRYFGQIHRYFQEQASARHRQPDFVQPDLFRSLNPDEPRSELNQLKPQRRPAAMPGGVVVCSGTITSADHHDS